MYQVLEKAIYYSSSVAKNVTIEFSCDGTRSDLKKVISTFRSNVTIRNIFGSPDNICYDICDLISYNYSNLLLNEIGSILIITRYDDVIKINLNPNNNIYGIIKIDSVIAENYSITNDWVWFKNILYYGSLIGSILIITKFDSTIKNNICLFRANR